MSDNKHLYIMQCKQYVKVGVSENPWYRIKALQTGNPFEIKLILTINYDDSQNIERNIHTYLEDKKERGEWFLIDNEVKELVKYMKNISYEMEKKNEQ